MRKLRSLMASLNWVVSVFVPQETTTRRKVSNSLRAQLQNFVCVQADGRWAGSFATYGCRWISSCVPPRF